MFKRAQMGLRLWAVAAALAMAWINANLAVAQCAHCGNQGGVSVSLDSEFSPNADGTILSDVLVDSPVDDCPHCGSGRYGSSPYDPNTSHVVSNSIMRSRGGHQDACDATPFHTSVRDELARRRQNELAACGGFHPRLQVRVGTTYMNRISESFHVLIESTSNPIRQVNAADFDFGWEPGLDASISQLAWDDTEFEFRFLGLREFSADQFVDTQGSEVRINSDPAVFAPNVESIDSRMTSAVYGFELNWHWVTYCPFRYIAGFRYVALDEDLTAALDAGPQTFAYSTSTRNDLYGAQIGVTSDPEMPLFGWHCLSWFGKVGIYGNDTRQRTILDTELIGQIVSESPDTSAVVWEFGVGLDVPIRDCLSIQGGYSALILDRVTVASDQLREIDFLTTTGSDNRGTVMFHGANLALVLRH